MSSSLLTNFMTLLLVFRSVLIVMFRASVCEKQSAVPAATFRPQECHLADYKQTEALTVLLGTHPLT